MSVEKLALDFYEALLMFKFDRRGMPETQFAALLRVDQLLDDMSGEANADVWTHDALRHDGRWQTVRDAAQRAMSLVSER